MKKIFIITLLFASTTGFISCSDDLSDYNKNPNAPESVLPNTIFNSATKQYTDFLRDDFNSGRLTLPWMQYWGQNAYADEDRYLYRETTAESLYRNTYLVATEFKSIIEINSNPETAVAASAVGNNNNQIAASRIMLAYMFHRLTDFFGDVPYYSYGSDDPDFQALQIDVFLSPKFAPQEKIYADVLKELREAADMINTSEPVFTSGDNIFSGDATNWKKFANSLILRVANRLKEVDPATANNAMSAAIASGVFTSNDDNAVQPYEANDTNGSPFWLAFLDRTDFAVAKPFVDLLKGDTGSFGPDPRLFEMAAPKDASIASIKSNSYDRSEDYDDYVGIPYAFPLANTLGFDLYSFPSGKIIDPDYGEVLMEYAEVAFILSENNNWDQGEYENGVRASMERWGVAEADVTAFVGSLPAATEETVLNQKYVGLYMQPHEAWSEYRRTGFPSTLVMPGETITLPPEQAAAAEVDTYVFEAGQGLTDLPTRLRYPQILQTLNGANRAEAVQGLDGGDVITAKLFWDVD
ncbi:SusD/RagB family nutrient-binding outer membrane lipoprotein [Marixanthomonas spongiae]|uniref:SusD/RagB family nutrient-binding outer membrane lipoprotein n=1 Tax=Marixanthomonas spongiae TaxID=2174845 RepID=A0A2U0I7J6_9FLAO|nr:SusD/RagB family nutrient-binding outer membrane lipoprotein [Marixanthomonas spongiae]PVW17068.1 SusD/RagB family nutrient-binding outer membrane lipoprotein [Marixanthomonas spongiae]